MAKTDRKDPRSIERIREHYVIEKQLADRPRNASREEWRSLYIAVYEELYNWVPDHPQLTRKASPTDTVHKVSMRMNLLQRFLRPSTTFLEIGPGDCSFVRCCRKKRKTGLCCGCFAGDHQCRVVAV